MTQHPSLRASSKDKQHRSVLKRFEKIEQLKKKGLWKEGENSPFGLPKVKTLRFKVKKEKSADAAAAGKEVKEQPASVSAPKTQGKTEKK